MSGALPDSSVPGQGEEAEDCWDPPPSDERADETAAVAAVVSAPEDRKSLCVAVTTMLLSIPALVGSWCWPLLVAGMFSSLTNINTAATRAFSHSLTFGINFAVFTNIVQYAVARTNKSRSGKAPWINKWGPALCLVFATLFSMADLVRHLINDAWGTACNQLDESQVLQLCSGQNASSCQPLDKKFDKACFSRNVMNEFSGGADDIFHLSAYGWFFTIFCTWTGFILLFIGIFWLIDFPQKFRARWRALRGSRSVDPRPLRSGSV